MTGTLIAFGSNLPQGSLSSTVVIATALDRLESTAGLNILWVSPLYQSAAVPAGSGPDFVNGVACLETGFAPDALLELLHQVEALAGRVRRRRWGPRTLDLDLLAMGGQVLPDAATERHWREMSPKEAAVRAPDRLILPHPRMTERTFVLVPLARMAPDWLHPVLEQTAEALARALPEKDRARLRMLATGPAILHRTALPDGRLLEIRRTYGAPGVELRLTDRAGAVVVTRQHPNLADALAATRHA